MGKNKITHRSDWVFGDSKNRVLKDKEGLIKQYILYMLNRTQRMFEYSNLPDSLPQREIELLTQCNAFTIWKRVDGELYVFFGGLGGVPDEYYRPSTAIVSNPKLKYYETLEIDDECVVMWNDSTHIGLMPLFRKYAELLAETDISLRLACVNSRILALVCADNDKTKDDAETFFTKVDEGEIGVISGSQFFEGIKTQDYGNKANTNIKDLIELQQYLKSSWFIELGINANYNMKRESINESESAMNEDSLLPLIDDMLEQRKLAVEKVNTMFGTNISVQLSSSWKKIRNDIVKSEEPQETPQEKEGDQNE